MLALHHQRAPPTINLDAAAPADVQGLAHVTLAEPHSQRPLRTALCNSFGFGGVNASLCFRRWDPS